MRSSWEQAKDVFQQALERDDGERDHFLISASGDDRELLDRVQRLLEAHRAADSTFMEHPAYEPVGTPVGTTWHFEAAEAGGAPIPGSAGKNADLRGLEVGAYRLLEEIGHGGMGTVYRAQRIDDAYEKVVAVKTINPRLANTDSIRRFADERRLLARLDHPYIARLMDGGRTDDGVMYLVMDLVDGQAINSYCDQERLNLRRRIELFRDVCAAVQFAHQNLIVHRDLKPANILIHSDGRPRLLDFGIALLIDAHGSDDRQTAPGMSPMTLRYASPEQIHGQAITTATDVYSLGVILYELLAGHIPYLGPDDSGRFSPETWVRAISEETPPSPSRRVNHLSTGPDSARVALQRRCNSASQLARSLRGDLDQVVLKALRKDPAQRYSSVEQLSDDLGRYLNGFPVSARRDTAGYVLRRFARRNPALSSTLAAAAVLAVGLAVATFFLWRQNAELEQQKSLEAQLNNALVDLFEIADPSRSGGPQITTADFLEQAEEQVLGVATGSPEYRVKLLDALGRMFAKTGNYKKARQILEQAAEVLEGPGGESVPPETAFTCRLHLAKAHLLLMDRDRAEPLYLRILEDRQRMAGGADPILAEVLMDLGTLNFFFKEPAQAVPFFQQALDIHQEIEGPEGNKVAQVSAQLAGAISEIDPERSLQLLKQSASIHRRALGENHPTTVASLFQLAIAHFQNNQLTEAQVLLEQVDARSTELYGEADPRRLQTLSVLSRVLNVQGLNARAFELASTGLDLARRHIPHLPLTGDFMVLVNLHHLYRGEPDAAETILESYRELRPQWQGTFTSETMFDNYSIEILRQRGELEKAEVAARRMLSENEIDDVLSRSGYQAMLAVILEDQGRYEEAVGLAEEVVRSVEQTFPAGHLRRLEPMLELIRFLHRLGRFEEAHEPLERCRALVVPLPEMSSLRAVVDSLTAENLAGRGITEGVQAQLTDAHRRLQAQVGPRGLWTVRAKARADL